MRYRVFRSVFFSGVFVALLLFLPCSSFAATKKAKPKDNKLKPSQVYSVTVSGVTYHCADIKGKPIGVMKDGKAYYKGEDSIKNLKDKVSKASGRSKKKLQKQLSTLKTKVKNSNSACKSHGGKNGGGSTSLTKLTRALTRDDVSLLLDRSAFGLSASEESFVTLGLQKGVEALVDEILKVKEEPAGLLARVTDRLDTQLNVSTTQTPAGQRQGILDLWIHTNNPFAEKLAMTLLGIWTVSGEVIEDETFRSSFWDYYQRLRAYAYGETYLIDMAVEITRDPLMLIYLNNDLNVKGNPNENYARELMELFTLGPSDLDGNPNYTESQLDGSGDIAIAAKMLTGWKVKKDYALNKLVPEYVSSRHEPGPHTMFAGTSRQFSGENYEDLVRGIFAKHPGVKFYYARELLKLYLTPDPSRSLIEAFANVIESNNFKLRPALRELFMSEAFYDVTYKDTVPLDPYDFIARSVRMMKLQNGVNIGEVEHLGRQMGFEPNQAPSVFWYPQDAWNSSNTIMEKANLLSQLFNDQTSQQKIGWTPQTVLPQGAVTLLQLVGFVQSTLNIDSFTTGQEQALIAYLTTKKIYNGTYEPFTYSNANTEHQRNKGLGLYYLMFLSPKFQLL